MDCHAPQLVGDVIATVIPLLFTGRHSNLLAGKIGEVIVQSAMSGVHHVLKGLTDIFSEEGQSWCYRCCGFFLSLGFLPWENINQTVACGILDFNFLIQYPKGLILSFQNIN